MKWSCGRASPETRKHWRGLLEHILHARLSPLLPLRMVIFAAPTGLTYGVPRSGRCGCIVAVDGAGKPGLQQEVASPQGSRIIEKLKGSATLVELLIEAFSLPPRDFGFFKDLLHEVGRKLEVDLWAPIDPPPATLSC